MSHDFQSQQVSKKKKKRRAESLLGAPFHLKDGDTIGIKVFIITLLLKKCLIIVIIHMFKVYLIFFFKCFSPPESFDRQQQGLCHPGGRTRPAVDQRAGGATQERVGLYVAVMTRPFKWSQFWSFNVVLKHLFLLVLLSRGQADCVGPEKKTKIRKPEVALSINVGVFR